MVEIDKTENGGNSNGNDSKDKPIDKPIEKPIEKQTKNEVVEAAKEAHAKLEELSKIAKESKKLNNLRRHIQKVQDAVQVLAERLIHKNEIAFAKILVANSMNHDKSKFSGIEWEYLVKEDPQEEISGEKLEMAIFQHVTTNDHHPERWGGIDCMPRESIAEMVCDLYTRSSEAGTDLMKYIKEVFVKKHNLSFSGKGYKTMKYFIDLLVDKPLKSIIPKA